MDSVDSRDIKHALSRLWHLPGFFCVFYGHIFFPATFKLHFSMSNKFGYQFITVEALSDFSRPLITKFLEF